MARTMSSMTLLPFLLALLLSVLRPVASLQVTQDSPCASVCVSTPHLSENTPDKVLCTNKDFLDTEDGQLFQSCLTCLQDSTYVKGDETDQYWFLYHARYFFDSCILGAPGGPIVDSNPCLVDDVCGSLDKTLKADLNKPASSDPYGYCEAENSVVLSTATDTCIECVRNDSHHIILGNFLVALKAGCQQKPAPGQVVGLNDHAFSNSKIAIVDPSQPDSSDDKSLGTPAIIGIVFGSLIFLVLVAAGTFFFLRRRRNASRKSRPSSSSVLSFHCQTHLSPQPTPQFPRHLQSSAMSESRRNFDIDPRDALHSNPVNSNSNSNNAQWQAPPAWHSHNNSVSSSVTLIAPPQAAHVSTSSNPYCISDNDDGIEDNYIPSPLSPRSPYSDGGGFTPSDPPAYDTLAQQNVTPGLAISTPGDTALYTGQRVVRTSLYGQQGRMAYQPFGSRRGGRRPSEPAVPVADDIDEEKAEAAASMGRPF